MPWEKGVTRGVLTRISLDPHGLSTLAEICEGTNLGRQAILFGAQAQS
jgi:hypothetical protein